MFKSQLNLMLNKMGFKISFTFMLIIACALPVYYAVSNLILGNDISHVVSKQYAYMFNDWSPVAEYMTYLIPVIAMLPFSASFMTDNKLNYAALMMTRRGVMEYYLSKALCCGIGGFTVFFVPAVINIIINQLFFPMSNKNVNYEPFADLLLQNYNPATSYIEINPNFPMLSLFANHPQIYNLLMALTMGFLCSVFALVAYAVSLYLKKYFYLSALPMITMLLLGGKNRELWENGTIPNGIFVNLMLTDYAATESLQGKSYPLFFIICLALALASLFMIIKKARDNV